MGASSVRKWVRHFKDRNTDTADQPCCGLLRSTTTENNEQKADIVIKRNEG